MKNKSLIVILSDRGGLIQNYFYKIPKQGLQDNEEYFRTQRLSFRSPPRRIRLRNLFIILRKRFLPSVEMTTIKVMHQTGRKIWLNNVIHQEFAKMLNKNIFIVLFILLSVNGFSQPDRSTINKGVDLYEQKKFTDAEVNFRKGVEETPTNFEANFNLGDSYYKQEKYDEAIKSFQSALGNAKDDFTRAKIYHNIGNSLLKSNKIQECVEEYKTALKYNPDDQDTKYNLSYALELLKNKDKNKQQQNQNDKNDKNKDDQKNQQNQDQQNKDQNKQQQNPQPKDEESKQDNTKQQQKPKENQISKEEAQRILDALKNNEKDLQKKLRKKTGRPYKTDKDW